MRHKMLSRLGDLTRVFRLGAPDGDDFFVGLVSRCGSSVGQQPTVRWRYPSSGRESGVLGTILSDGGGSLGLCGRKLADRRYCRRSLVKKVNRESVRRRRLATSYTLCRDVVGVLRGRWF